MFTHKRTSVLAVHPRRHRPTITVPCARRGGSRGAVIVFSSNRLSGLPVCWEADSYLRSYRFQQFAKHIQNLADVRSHPRNVFSHRHHPCTPAPSQSGTPLLFLFLTQARRCVFPKEKNLVSLEISRLSTLPASLSRLGTETGTPLLNCTVPRTTMPKARPRRSIHCTLYFV